MIPAKIANNFYPILINPSEGNSVQLKPSPHWSQILKDKD